MTWRYRTLGVLWCVIWFTANAAGRLPAEDRDLKARPSRDTGPASLTGHRLAAPQTGAAPASARRVFAKPSAAETLFSDVPDDLLSDDGPAASSNGTGIRLVSDESSPLPASEGDEEEIDFDPGAVDLFQRVQPGDDEPYLIMPSDDEPLGWVGMEYLRPTDLSGSDFYPVPDRYRQGFPSWNRYVNGNPFNPYRQNVLKGDYPISVGGNTFLEVTAVSDSFIQFRRKTVNVAKADGTVDATKTKLQTDTQQRQRFFVTADYFEDDNTFTPSPWFFRLTQVVEYRDQSDAVGYHDDYAFLEAFVDYRIAFLTDYGDQLNVRVGRQQFNADFRGFLFNDFQNMVRLFGTWNENKWQYNVVAMSAVQADPVTQFLSFYQDRDQKMVGANVFRRDVPWLGFNLMGGAWFVNDNGTGNVGFQPKHEVDVGYFEVGFEGVLPAGFATSGAFIQAVGRDAFNPVAQRSVNINGQFVALELTRPTDWFTPRVSIMYASGDKNPKGGTATGFDTVSDFVNFAGNNFAYFGREQLQGRGNQITNFNSFLPNLRNRFFDAVNFVNPGIMALTAGFDTTVTTQVNAFFNYNYYDFVQPAALEQAIANKGGGNINIHKDIGQDITLGINYRPLVINNVTCNFGTTGFFQGRGFQDISGNNAVLFTHFANLVLTY